MRMLLRRLFVKIFGLDKLPKDNYDVADDNLFCDSEDVWNRNEDGFWDR